MYVEISDGNKQQNILVQKLSRTFQKIIVSTLVKFAKACLIIIVVYFHYNCCLFSFEMSKYILFIIFYFVVISALQKSAHIPQKQDGHNIYVISPCLPC